MFWRQKPRDSDSSWEAWRQIPGIAYEAQDYFGSSPTALANILNPRCNRAAWDFEPTPGFRDYIAQVEADDACEIRYQDMFARYGQDMMINGPIHHSEKRTFELNNKQKLEVALDRSLIIPGVESYIERLQSIGNGLLQVAGKPIEFEAPDISFFTQAEALHKRLRGNPGFGFHMDGKGERVKKHRFTIIDNLIGARTHTVKANLYGDVLQLAHGTKYKGPVTPEDRNDPSYLRRLKEESDKRLEAAIKGLAIAAPNKNAPIPSIIEEMGRYQTNIFSCVHRKHEMWWLPGTTDLKERVACVHSVPFRIDRKRLTTVWRGCFLES